MTTKRAKKSHKKVDFSHDEDGVLAEIAKCLDFDPDELTIKSGSSPNGHGDAYTISTRGGRKEYIVMEDEESFESAAIEGVERDLDENPEGFNRNFLENFINIGRLRRELHSDVYDSAYDSLREEAERRPEEFLKQHSIDFPSPSEKQMREYAESESDDEKSASQIYEELIQGDNEDRWIAMGEEPTVPDDEIENVAEEVTNDQLRDPIAYLSEIYDSSEAIKQAFDMGGIDTKKAAEQAVSDDGAAHFMCGYDGNYDTSPSGFVYWQHN